MVLGAVLATSLTLMQSASLAPADCVPSNPTPEDPRFAFDLAALQESQGFIDASEGTLLTTRQAHATNIEVYRRRAQFYARRVTVRTAANREQ